MAATVFFFICILNDSIQWRTRTKRTQGECGLGIGRAYMWAPVQRRFRYHDGSSSGVVRVWRHEIFPPKFLRGSGFYKSFEYIYIFRQHLYMTERERHREREREALVPGDYMLIVEKTTKFLNFPFSCQLEMMCRIVLLVNYRLVSKINRRKMTD